MPASSETPAENQVVEAPSTPPASPADETLTAAPQRDTQPEEVTPPAGDTQPEEPKPEPSHRLKKRFEKIYEKGRQEGLSRAQAEAQVAGLDARMPFDSQEQSLLSELEEKAQNGELSFADIDRLAALRAEQKVSEALARRDAQSQAQAKVESILTDFEKDVNAVQAKYPHFDPESEQFDEKLTQKLSDMYLDTFGANPTAAPRFLDWITSIEELRGSAADEGAARSADILSEQAASTAIRPAGGANYATRPSPEVLVAEAKESGDWSKVLKQRLYGEQK